MKKEIQNTRKSRDSNIELLKILAILLIIISHWCQTLSGGEETGNVPVLCAINLSLATTNIKYLFLSFCRYFGSIGNTLFFVCSAWFLIDSDTNKKQKVLSMLLDVWLVSALILFTVSFDIDVELHGSMILKCLLPTTFSNNWYITAYIIFYLIYPALNKLINTWNQKTHLSVIAIALFVYCVWYPLFKEWGASLYLNQIIMWVIIYFAIAYMKRYLNDFCQNAKANVLLFVLSLLCIIGSIAITNFLGLRHAFFNDRLLQYITTQNLFVITLGISLLNLFKMINMQSKFVNIVSSLSLLIYIIHENILIRRFYRPIVLNKIYEIYGNSHIIFWIFALAIATFIISAMIAFLYSKTLQKLTRRMSNEIYPMLVDKYNKLLSKILVA